MVAAHAGAPSDLQLCHVGSRRGLQVCRDAATEPCWPSCPPLEITPGTFSFRVVHKSTVAALVERACSAQVTFHSVRSDKLDQAGRRAAMAAGAAMIISCTTTSAATPTAFASPFMPVPALESLKDEVCIRFVWFAMFAIDLSPPFYIIGSMK